MEGRPRVAAQPAYALTDEAVAAVRALQAGDREPMVLAYYPVARTNPFEALLYGRLWAAGIAPVPLVYEERLAELTELLKAGIPAILHLHWINIVMKDAKDAKDARKLGEAFLKKLDAFKGLGGRLVWTVHNILPHGAPFEDQEAWLRGEVAARADVVHVMAASTPEQVAPYFTIPAEKVLHVPHPSYAGAYEDYVTREQARHELGIMPDEIVHSVLGAIKPYKGLNELLDAWDELALDGVPRRLVIAGKPDGGPAMARILERAALHPTVLLHARSIPAGEMQLFLRSADIGVMPYLRTLNSGAQLLALTFGLPVVVPAESGLAELIDERSGRTFTPGSKDALVAALRAADQLVTPEARAAAKAVAEARHPATVSERFAFGLRERLDARRP